MSINCELTAISDVEHLQQIYTGFQMLHRQKIINLKQIIPAAYLQNKDDQSRWDEYIFFNTNVILNNEIRICYDTHDWNLIDEKILSECDFYFKRSFDEIYLEQIGEKHKVFPLGLNYQVTSDKVDFFRAKRAAFYSGKDKIKLLLKALRLDNFLPNSETERIDRMESAPDFSLEPQVLFMARAWNPKTILDPAQKELVAHINEFRAESIRALRKNFGKRFFGGLMRDSYSEEKFKDVLLPDNNLSNKRNYLAKLKKFPICVATTGLNHSTGWKLAEYVAFSKAIVSEPLKFKTTGDFTTEKNYLEFHDSEELIGAVARLIDGKNLRGEMMKNNREYYEKFVCPDALVLNTLRTVADQRGFSL